MAFKSLGKGMWKNIKAAHKVEGIGAAYLKRAGIGAGIGAVGGGIWEAAEGGSFGDGMISGAAKGAAVGAGTVLYKSAGLGSNIFQEGTRRMNKGAFGNFGKMWRGNLDVTDDMMKYPKKKINIEKARLKQGMSVNKKNNIRNMKLKRGMSTSPKGKIS